MNTAAQTQPTAPPAPAAASNDTIVNLDPDLRDIYRCFGQNTVLIPLRDGKSLVGQWNKLTLEQSHAPKHQAALWGADIGVACGPASQNLCGLRVQDTVTFERLLADNPALRGTLMTRGPAATTLWIRVTGFCPTTKTLDTWSWLSSGAIGIVLARPPGAQYQCVNAAQPVTVKLDDIVWPDSMMGAFIDEKVTLEQGAVALPGEKPRLNLHYVAGYFKEACKLLYDPHQQRMFVPDASRQRYVVMHENVVMAGLSNMMVKFGRAKELAGAPIDRSPRVLRQLIQILQVIAVGRLPAEQDSVVRFLTDRVESHQDVDITTEELFGAYQDFCTQAGFQPCTENEFQRRIPDLVRERFGVAKRHCIERDGRHRRGFPHVRLRVV